MNRNQLEEDKLTPVLAISLEEINASEDSFCDITNFVEFFVILQTLLMKVTLRIILKDKKARKKC